MMNAFKMSNKTIDKVKYDLVREGLIDYNSLVDAVEKSERMGLSLSQVLVQDNMIQEKILISFLESKLHIPYVNLEDYKLDVTCLQLIKENDARKFKIIPLFKIEDTLTVAMSDPLDFFALNNIIVASNYKVEPVICSETSIITAINKFYTHHQEVSLPPATQKISVTTNYDWRKEINFETHDTIQATEIIKGIIQQALIEQASDIHINPEKTVIKVKFRIDGILYEKGSLPILMLSAISGSIKSQIGINPSASPLPQSGRLEILIDQNTISARVATLPTNYGEKITIKIFAKAPHIDKLGLEDHDLNIFKNNFNKTNGIILASGHIGAGQQTTFYSLLSHFADGKKNIITLENPIRYTLEHTNQSQINYTSGYTYENALQSIILQEPDIIYIENIHSKELLTKIFDLAIAGKSILSSMFANNVIETLFNIMDSGIKTETMLSNVNLIFTQKLIRTLCPHCKKEYLPHAATLHQYTLPDTIKYYKTVGCIQCNEVGYLGRTAVFEILEMTPNIKHALRYNVTERSLLEAARKNGMTTMRQNAILKLKRGITTIQEVQHIFDEYNIQTPSSS